MQFRLHIETISNLLIIMIDISFFDTKEKKVDLLKGLWENMNPASFFTMNGFPTPEFDEKLALSAVEEYIDYFQGRCIKTNISGTEVDPWLYDRDAGKDAFQKVVDAVKEELE